MGCPARRCRPQGRSSGRTLCAVRPGVGGGVDQHHLRLLREVVVVQHDADFAVASGFQRDRRHGVPIGRLTVLDVEEGEGVGPFAQASLSFAMASLGLTVILSEAVGSVAWVTKTVAMSACRFWLPSNFIWPASGRRTGWIDLVLVHGPTQPGGPKQCPPFIESFCTFIPLLGRGARGAGVTGDPGAHLVTEEAAHGNGVEVQRRALVAVVGKGKPFFDTSNPEVAMTAPLGWSPPAHRCRRWRPTSCCRLPCRRMRPAPTLRLREGRGGREDVNFSKLWRSWLQARGCGVFW